jgi:hypothetical protein
VGALVEGAGHCDDAQAAATQREAVEPCRIRRLRFPRERQVTRVKISQAALASSTACAASRRTALLQRTLTTPALV